jgi:hypothetical protein
MDISKVPQGLSSKFLARNSVTGDEKEVSIGTEADVTALVTHHVCDASRILNFILGDFIIPPPLLCEFSYLLLIYY